MELIPLGTSSSGYDGSAAYEYQRFEEPEKKKIKQVPGRALSKGFSAAKAVLYMLVVVVLASMLIYTRVEQMVLNDQYNTLLGQLNEIKNTNASLQLQLETRLSLNNIEAYAREHLGMSEVKNQQIEYINFDTLNKAEVIEQDSFWEELLQWFRSLAG